jgi:hypothetical protein
MLRSMAHRSAGNGAHHVGSSHDAIAAMSGPAMPASAPACRPTRVERAMGAARSSLVMPRWLGGENTGLRRCLESSSRVGRVSGRRHTPTPFPTPWRHPAAASPPRPTASSSAVKNARVWRLTPGGSVTSGRRASTRPTNGATTRGRDVACASPQRDRASYDCPAGPGPGRRSPHRRCILCARTASTPVADDC